MNISRSYPNPVPTPVAGRNLSGREAVTAPRPATGIDGLLERQNPDGGWPYSAGISWTEPTVYAVLAALAAGNHPAAERGILWLRRLQRPDGGWAPQPKVEESTWVTALVTLLPPERLQAESHQRGIEWLMRLTGRESTRIHRLRQWMLGAATPPEQQHNGWPWFPGTAAWVSPTSIALLALRKAAQRRTSPGLAARIEDGRQFLLTRMCKDGGWNHGSARALGFDGHAYPETTGMALAALAGTRSPQIDRALQVAKAFLSSERSVDARNWLTLGLLAHGTTPSGATATPLPCRTLRDRSLSLLVDDATHGRHWILAV